MRIFLSWFGLGYSRFAPGTMGSLGALPLCWALACVPTTLSRVLFILVFTLLTIILAALEQKESGAPDPQYIVADEVAGMLTACLFLPRPQTVSSGMFVFWLMAAFGLFRALDILKPFPISIFDRISKRSSHPYVRGAAIVLDDSLAGLVVAFINLAWLLLQ